MAMQIKLIVVVVVVVVKTIATGEYAQRSIKQIILIIERIYKIWLDMLQLLSNSFLATKSFLYHWTIDLKLLFFSCPKQGIILG